MLNPLLIIVPARSGSKRLPGKNLRLLCGKSLLERTANAIAESGINAPVLLSTDDNAIAQEGERLGWFVPFRRPAEFATDSAKMIDVVLHALDWYRDCKNADTKFAMLLQPTSPFRGGSCLAEAVALLETNANIDCVVGMRNINLPPTNFYQNTSDGTAVPIGTSDLSPVLVPNGALYLARVKALRAERTVYTKKLWALIFDQLRSIDIDTPSDWSLAESVIEKNLLGGKYNV
jgi:CMP-N,N'-diacetyllegionaminic acid synthase